jgi:hypothetical protein
LDVASRFFISNSPENGPKSPQIGEITYKNGQNGPQIGEITSKSVENALETPQNAPKMAEKPFFLEKRPNLPSEATENLGFFRFMALVGLRIFQESGCEGS